MQGIFVLYIVRCTALVELLHDGKKSLSLAVLDDAIQLLLRLVRMYVCMYVCI